MRHDTRGFRLWFLLAFICMTGFSCLNRGWINIKIPEGTDGFAFFLEVENAVQAAGLRRVLLRPSFPSVTESESSAHTDIRLNDGKGVVAQFDSRAVPGIAVDMYWYRKSSLVQNSRHKILVTLTDRMTMAGDKVRPEARAQFEILRKAITIAFGEENISVNPP